MVPPTILIEVLRDAQQANRAYQCPAYISIVPAGIFSTGDPGGGLENWSYSYNIFGSTHGSADVPNLDYCLGLGVNVPWLYDFVTGQAGENSPGDRNSTPNLPACRESQVAAPSELFALMDSRGGGGGFLENASSTSFTWAWVGWDWAQGTLNYSYNGMTGEGYQALAPQPQHGKVFNVLFADGHVTDARLSYLWNMTNSARQWNVDNKPHPESWRAADDL